MKEKGWKKGIKIGAIALALLFLIGAVFAIVSGAPSDNSNIEKQKVHSRRAEEMKNIEKDLKDPKTLAELEKHKKMPLYNYEMMSNNTGNITPQNGTISTLEYCKDLGVGTGYDWYSSHRIDYFYNSWGESSYEKIIP